jgi:hypothetical protein
MSQAVCRKGDDIVWFERNQWSEYDTKTGQEGIELITDGSCFGFSFRITIVRPYLGFQLIELPACCVWIRHDMFVDVHPHAEEGSLLTITGGQGPATIQVAAQSESVQLAIEQMTQEFVNDEDPSAVDCEARRWLQASTNKCAFAYSRFKTTAHALAFMERLYRAGALFIIIDQLIGHSDEEGPYACSCTVTIPADEAASRTLLYIFTEEAQRGCSITPIKPPHTFSLEWNR